MTWKTLAGSPLPRHVKEDLTNWMNYSKSNSTWSSYRTVERMLERCQTARKTRFSWPMTRDDNLNFIHWLLKDRGLKTSTVHHYLAGVRHAHISRGLEPPQIRSTLIQQVLKGHANKEATGQIDTTRQGRAPMTIELMKTMKTNLCKSSMDKRGRLLLWAVATLAFHGAFRIHELLAKHESTFDPLQCLLAEDVQVTGTAGKRAISIRLKCPKERKAGRPTVVDVLEVGGPLCPVKAFVRWHSRVTAPWGRPLFTWPDGTPLTGRRFNNELKNLLGRLAVTKRGKISSHSFRSAVPTILGELGHSEKDIKAVGRWSSRAFTLYMKGTRTQRLRMAKKIADLV